MRPQEVSSHGINMYIYNNRRSVLYIGIINSDCHNHNLIEAVCTPNMFIWDGLYSSVECTDTSQQKFYII